MFPLDPPLTFAFLCVVCALRRQTVEAAIHSTRGLQGRDQRLREWKSKAYGMGNAEARALSSRLLDGKQVCVVGSVCMGVIYSQHVRVRFYTTFSTTIFSTVGARSPSSALELV